MFRSFLNKGGGIRNTKYVAKVEGNFELSINSSSKCLCVMILFSVADYNVNNRTGLVLCLACIEFN